MFIDIWARSGRGADLREALIGAGRVGTGHWYCDLRSQKLRSQSTSEIGAGQHGESAGFDRSGPDGRDGSRTGKKARAAGGRCGYPARGRECLAGLTRRQSPTLNFSGEVTVLDEEPGTRGNVAAYRAAGGLCVPALDRLERIFVIVELQDARQIAVEMFRELPQERAHL